MVGRVSRRDGRGQVACRKVVWPSRRSGGPPGGQEALQEVSRPSWRSAGPPGGQEALPQGWAALPKRRERSGGKGREALRKSWEWSGGPPEGPVGVERPSRRAGKGLEDLQEVREGSGGPRVWPERVERLSRKTLLEDRWGSEGPPGGLGGVERPSQRAGTGWEALLVGWHGSGDPRK